MNLKMRLLHRPETEDKNNREFRKTHFSETPVYR